MLSTRHLRLKANPGKLKPRFIGPFIVEQTIGSNAFRLKLPDAMHVHPVFNIALLRKFHGEYTPPAPIEVEGEAEYEVESILRHRGRSNRR